MIFQQIVVYLAAGLYFYYGHRISKDKPLDKIDRFVILFGLWCYAFWLLTTAYNFADLGFEP